MAEETDYEDKDYFGEHIISSLRKEPGQPSSTSSSSDDWDKTIQKNT